MQTRERTVDIAAIQKELQDAKLSGWLFYSFHGSDPLAATILQLGATHFVSRRWFYFIPAKGTPIKLVHRIEMDSLDSLPGDKLVYLGWRELESQLKAMLSEVSGGQIAMQYSPNNAVPYVSRVDAGTIELVKGCGVSVVSSANLVALFESRLSTAQLASHKKAVDFLRVIVFEAFTMIRKRISEKQTVNEYQIQQLICQRFEHYGMTTNSPPIVAVNEHSGLPHYQPTEKEHSEIKHGDFVLLDIWAKLKQPADAIYGDITWTGFVGTTVPEKYKNVFDIVSGARDAAVEFIRKAVDKKEVIQGWQVDDITRNFITERGHGDDFVHRTGHSIGIEVHGNGTNIDNLETQDRRNIIPNTCFSIEPGVYLPEFGIRSEIDVYVGEDEVVIAGQPIQREVIPIMAKLS
jgi:Xaa-Pro dipeptidase